MGVILDLRMIDHERIVVSGLPVLNQAIRERNPEILRKYLNQLPIEIDERQVDFRSQRLAKLREIGAPIVILENEERLLRYANGEAFQPSAYAQATMDELRQLLGTWCWPTHSFSLDKSWDELRWFLEPLAGPSESPLYPYYNDRLTDSGRTIFALALQGSIAYPEDELGQPVIRTLGSAEADCSGYNPPEVVTTIDRAVREVNPEAWDLQIPFRSELYRRAMPGLDDADIADRVRSELEWAREAFATLKEVYAKAALTGFAVSCEYSL